MRRLGSFLPGDGVGGSGVHWSGHTWRWTNMEFKVRSMYEERYGKKFIPDDMTIQDWGITYEELEPYYDRFEYTAAKYNLPFDLGEWRAHGDPITIGLELAARAVSEGRDDYARLNGLIPPSARRAIVVRTGFSQYLVEDPLELHPELRTPRWQDLCDHLKAYATLDPDARMRVLWLLHRLCMHSAVLRYETD